MPTLRAVQFTLSLLIVENLVSEQSFRSGGNVLLVHSAASERWGRRVAKSLVTHTPVYSRVMAASDLTG